jgi:outer membrane protein assembly factor BamB
VLLSVKRVFAATLVALTLTTILGSCATHNPSGASCSRPSVSKGVVARGLEVGQADSPKWSGEVSAALAVAGTRAFSDSGGACVSEIDASSGAAGWSWAAGGSAIVMGAVATEDAVVVATGHSHGTAPAAVMPATDRVVGLDPRTGVRRWSVEVGQDGQSVPAVVSDGSAIIAKADGSLLGVDAVTGRSEWVVPAPAGCTSSKALTSPDVAVNLLPGVGGAIVDYHCDGPERLVQLDASSGAARWTRSLPDGWAVQYQSPAASDATVLGVLVSGNGAAIAPLRSSSHDVSATTGTVSLIALNAATGAPLWQVDGISSAAGAYSGAGRLCTASGSGATCYAEASGAQSWQRASSAPPSSSGLSSFGDGVVAENGLLHVVEATAAATSIPPESTTYRAAPGTFVLETIDMSTGRVLDSRALPAFDGGPDQVDVSPDSPPGVVGAADGVTLVSPQLDETTVIEAFAR